MEKKKFLEIIIAAIFIIAAVLISFIPTFYYLAKSNETIIFPLIHNNHPDYYYYLSLMQQGLEGKWLVTSRFTPESFQPQFAQTFFVLMGFFGRITHIGLPLIYTLARLIFALSVGFSVYLLLVLFDKRKVVRIVGTAFVMFGSSFWIWRQSEIKQFLTFWTSFDARERTTFLPHHLFGSFAIVLSLIFLTIYFKAGRKKWLISAAFTGFIGTFVNPITFGNFLPALVLAFLLFAVVNFNNKTLSKNYLLPLLLFLVSCFIPFIYFLIIQGSTFPWTTYNPTRNMLNFGLSFKEYVLGLGPVFLFSLFGLKRIFTTKDFLGLVLFSWILIPFIGIFLISKNFNFGNVFFFYAFSYIPIGIIGALGFTDLTEFFAKNFRIKREILLLPLFLLLMIYFAFSWYGSIKKEISRWTPNIFNIFLPRDFFLAFNFLNNNSDSESVVLTGEHLGTIIPAFTHNRVVIGHPVNTYDFENKKTEVTEFFLQSDIDKAVELIKKYRVDYVFFTYDTGSPDETFINSLKLKLVYKNSTVRIYQTL